MCKSGLSSINSSLTQTRTVSCFTHVLVWLGGLHIGAVATFCKKEWLMEHVNTPINEIVVMYQSAEQIIRPPAPPDVSVCKGIMSCFSFLFLGVPRHYVKRPFRCWCQACSRVRGRGLGFQSSGHISWWQAVRVLDRLDRRPVHSHIINRDSESREKGSRYCCEGAEKGQTWRVGVHTGSRSVVN